VYKGKRNKDEQKGLTIITKKYYDGNPKYSFLSVMYGGKPNISRMLNNICDYEPRTYMIVCELVKILDDEPGRNVLILSDRRNHLVAIYEIICGRTNITKDNIGYYVGGMKSDDLIITESKQIILGTYNMISEGFDLPKLDTLIMASPKSNVEQSIGRIQRQNINVREYRPLVLDVVDDFSVFRNQGIKRHKFYKKSGFDVSGDDVINNKDDFKLIGVPMFL
jgi:superfamily II DNA or RNA helicase